MSRRRARRSAISQVWKSVIESRSSFSPLTWQVRDQTTPGTADIESIRGQALSISIEQGRHDHDSSSSNQHSKASGKEKPVAPQEGGDRQEEPGYFHHRLSPSARSPGFAGRATECLRNQVSEISGRLGGETGRTRGGRGSDVRTCNHLFRSCRFCRIRYTIPPPIMIVPALETYPGARPSRRWEGLEFDEATR